MKPQGPYCRSVVGFTNYKKIIRSNLTQKQSDNHLWHLTVNRPLRQLNRYFY